MNGLALEVKSVVPGRQMLGRGFGERTAGRAMGDHRTERSKRVGALLAPDPQAMQWRVG